MQLSEEPDLWPDEARRRILVVHRAGPGFLGERNVDVPLSRSIARLNRVGLNRVTRHIAPWAPGFGLVMHRGRRSGRTFRTPVNVFVRDHEYVFALTYGLASDWVKNVQAAGGCDLETHRRTVHLCRPRLEHQQSRPDLPWPVRTILRATKVHDFLILEQRKKDN